MLRAVGGLYVARLLAVRVSVLAREVLCVDVAVLLLASLFVVLCASNFVAVFFAAFFLLEAVVPVSAEVCLANELPAQSRQLKTTANRNKVLLFNIPLSSNHPTERGPSPLEPLPGPQFDFTAGIALLRAL